MQHMAHTMFSVFTPVSKQVSKTLNNATYVFIRMLLTKKMKYLRLDAFGLIFNIILLLSSWYCDEHSTVPVPDISRGAAAA